MIGLSANLQNSQNTTIQRGAHRNTRRGNTGDRRRIQLLECATERGRKTADQAGIPSGSQWFVGPSLAALLPVSSSEGVGPSPNEPVQDRTAPRYGSKPTNG